MFQSLPARAAALCLILWLAGCASQPPAPMATPACPPAFCPACPGCPACPVCPLPEPLKPEPPKPPAPALQPADWSALAGFGEDAVREALPALRQSCTTLAKSEQWAGFCRRLAELGASADEATLRALLQAELLPWRVVNPDGSEEGLITGYYEPLIKGSRHRNGRARWPIHGVPDDLVSIELADVYPDLKKWRLRGRLEGRSLKPYWTRAEIEARAASLPARVLFWADDPVELFFLQVQGSGRVELPDGQQVRLGYADQNGHPYQSIGRWLVDKGELSLDKASMAGIKSWANANPTRLSELLNSNPSYVFFREMPNNEGGPLGAMGLPLTDGRSIAIDPRSIPLGAPVFLATQWPNSEQPLRRLVVAQDTGGAIKGAVRADLFWGFGGEAGVQAGRMRQKGRMWVLLPRGFAPQ